MLDAWAGRPRIVAALTGALSPAEVAEAFCVEARDALRAVACSVHVAGEDGLVTPIAHAGEPRELTALIAPPDRGAVALMAVRPTAAGESFSTRTAVWIEVDEPPSASPRAVRAAFSAPLLVGARAIGIFALGLEEARRFDDDEQRLADAIVARCAQAIERAQLIVDKKSAEQRFRVVFDYALDAMVVADDNRLIVDANAAALALLRRTRQELVGRRLRAFVPPRLHEGAGRVWSDVQRSGTNVGEIEVERGDGGTMLIEHRITAHVLPGKHLVVMRDIGDRKRAETMLHFLAEASAVLSSSLDYEATIASVTRLAVPTMADWALVDMLAPDGSIQRLAIAHQDPAKVRLAQELLRRWPQKSDDASAVARVVRSGRSEVHRHVSDEVLGAGEKEPDELTISHVLGLKSSMTVPLIVRGNALGALTLISAESGRFFEEADLTLAEDLGRRAAVAVENARSFRDAAEANRMKDEFLATMSHELRSPLGAILGWATILRADHRNDRELDKGLATIERNARAQVRLIEDVLDVSRIVDGRLHLELRPLDASAIAVAAVEVVRPLADAKDIVIEAVLGDQPLTVLADADRLQQVISNLLSNSVKFTPRGGSIRIECARRDPAACIVVTDTGQGIAPDVFPFIFDRFRQADSSTTRRHAGLGLGLAIARHLVDLHGGSITASSRGVGQGASFTVLLPRSVDPREIDRPSQPVPPDEVFGGAPVLTGLRVVVCDDDPDTREWLMKVLVRAGADVRLAPSALDAIRQVREFSPDVLVSDIGMPDLDGYALIEKLRALPVEDGSLTPSLALSAYARGADARRAIASGFQMHLAKPAKPSDVVSRVAHLAGRLSRY